MGIMPFLVKKAERSARCGQVRSSIPHREIGKGAESSKKFTKRKQPLTTTPAGALMQMGPQNTPLAGEACPTRARPAEGNSLSFWAPVNNLKSSAVVSHLPRTLAP